MRVAFGTTVYRLAARLHRRAWIVRAVTLGARAVVLDGANVFLVRHTYVPGWYLPGGGVDRGESAEAAIRRELQEEAGILCRDTPLLHGLFLNGARDHVACYIVRSFDIDAVAAKRNGEIAEARFFPVDALPHDATAATRARLGEVFAGRAAGPRW